MTYSRSLLSKKTIEYFRNPRNVGSIEDADGIGESSNERTVFIKLYIKVHDEIITDAKFKTFGCGAAIAASSMATELIIGRSVTEAVKISNDTIVEALDGLPPEKLHCSLLAEEAIKSAIRDFHSRKDA